MDAKIHLNPRLSFKPKIFGLLDYGFNEYI